ncbi:UDP-glucose 4-epimerase GalE [Roseateles asaccharophilus]|uniref:UDP-glucose 4-epimerase n=1 Tax=Roseateles asaccharophilus TaxID=582607 RepID=A0ABU2AE02_9BURK|nr:UDP-glucose 4-epimerase GalE [Roseateles asaccharophilus]MDR7335335.1 UDP-glucose 4-epimerase [Roseateles asaccharophilus]
MRVLVTGGAGYIGSITTLQLLQAGHEVLVLDNFSNAKPAVLARIAQLAGREPVFREGDVRDGALLRGLLKEQRIEAVMHFAGLKAVGESVHKPLEYFDNNVQGSLSLLAAMRDEGVRTLVFSSSATVYGLAETMPLREDAPTGTTNPYGRSKLMVEQVLQDLAAADPAWSLCALRYFNPVGAHASGRLGEDPQGIPNNLMPFIAQVAVGRRAALQVFGRDYATPDGTGVRDYIHVEDLAAGHLAALAHVHGRPGWHVFNLGTGRGHSVLEVLRAYEAACGKPLAHEFVPRRGGDVAQSWADPTRAQTLLGWQATLGLDAMCVDSWRWQSRNPEGYGDAA